MIGKIITLPFSILKLALTLVFRLVSTVLSLVFGTIGFVLSRVFGTVFGAVVGLLLGKKHVGIKLFRGKKLKKQ
ncbi:MAG: hypothetical protein ACOC4C_00305 [Fibrobacterota bacterium]